MEKSKKPCRRRACSVQVDCYFAVGLPGMSGLLSTIRRCLLAPLVLVLLFEEWGWKKLARAFKNLARLPFWASLESAVSRLPPWAALLAFGLPVICLVPVKLLALYLFTQGHAATGLVMVLATKILGTALAARLFELTEPALMRLTWFARAYIPFKRWKDCLLAQVRQSALWRGLRVAKALLRRLCLGNTRP